MWRLVYPRRLVSLRWSVKEGGKVAAEEASGVTILVRSDAAIGLASGCAGTGLKWVWMGHGRLGLKREFK